MAYQTVVAGSTITAAWANASVRDQSVSPFASAAARSSAITAPVEGMVTHLNDVNSLGVYSGSAWSTVGPVHGALTTWTPAVVQLGAVTTTNNGSTYTRLGRLITARFLLAVTGSGTAANAVTISLPVTAAAITDLTGYGYIVDTSVTSQYHGPLQASSTTTTKIMGTTGSATGSVLGVNNFVAGLAAGDVVSGWMSFEAAADA